MIKNKISKILTIIIVAIIMITAIGQTVVFAADSVVKAKLSITRWIKNSSNAYSDTGKAYALNSGDSHPLFQILSVDGTDKTIGTNYYCLNALKGATWMNSNDGRKVDYDKSYDLVSQKDEIANSTSLVSTYKNVVSTNYGKLMWVLDNMYKEGGLTVEEVLANAGIVYGDTGATDARIDGTIHAYYYDPTIRPSSKISTDVYSDENFLGNKNKGKAYSYVDNGQVKNVILPKELVETVQQAVIWYFTNNSQYNCYTTSYSNINWLKYATNLNQNSWSTISNQTTTNSYNETISTGIMLQEQAAILYNYLVEEANAAGNNYVGTSVGTIDIEYTGSNTDSKITEKDSNYIIGPLKITTTGSTTLENIEVKSGSNTINGQVTDANGTSKTLKANENFYVKVAKSDATGTIKITANAEYTATDKKMWIKQVTQDANAEQPLVEVEGKKENIKDSIDIPLNKQFDLALRKTIVKIVDNNGNTKSILNEDGKDATRNITVDKNSIPDTAKYMHRKDPVVVGTGDVVTYRITIYNEGEIDGYASKIVDQLPTGLESVLKANGTVTSHSGNTYKVTAYDTTTNKLELSIETTNVTSIAAFDGTTVQNDYIEFDCKVTGIAKTDGTTKQYLTNIAYIAEEYDKDGNLITADRDGNESKPTVSPNKTADQLNNSDANNYKGDASNKSVYSDTTNGEYYKGEEDDDDFEKVVILPKTVDLALTKFITALSSDDKIENGEYLTPNKNIGSKTNEYIRATVADTTGLKNGTSTNATYTEKKDIEPLNVSKNTYILYNIRVYNEGEVDVYAGKITDYLPENIEFVEGEFNNQYGWTANGQTVKTTYLSSSNGTDKTLEAFDKENDDGKGSGLDYKDLPVLCKVSDKAESGKKMVNTAEITKYEDKDGNELPKDIDSTPDNKEEKNVEKRDEDDDDYEVVIIKEFDLALRKFITQIDTVNAQQNNTTPVTNFGREPKLTYENGKITYTHPKDVVRTTVDSIVTYTLRVFNEGDLAGYAEEISDDMPEYLEFLPEHEINREYKWVMYDNEGTSTTKVSEAVKIKTDYASKANGELLMKNNSELTENPNLLNAFDKEAGITDKNPDYVDVKVAFKVKDPKSNETIIVNKAQISEDADENGYPVEDIDSIPDKWNEGEDDQDYENVAVDYFDLSLLKYVTKAIVTENGKTKTTKTGNNGSKNDIIPKVEVYRKSLNKTIVKFEFTIKITNEGDIAGYAKEITDYVPKGLKFYKEDNKGWKDEGNNVISTELLKDTLLQPGQSATVKVILRWINGENNLGLKTNVAEISKDYNEKGVPDRDSTPDNKKKGEDDIDDAPVLLTISTGILEHTIQYVTGALVILVILGTGLVVIKKYVL